MNLVDPFKLFRRGVTEVSVWKYSARPGVDPVCLQESLPAFVKRDAASDMPVDYGTHEGQYSIHVRPKDFNENLPAHAVDWLDLVVEDLQGRRFLVVEVNVGDDFSTGTPSLFWRIYASLYGKTTL